MNRLLCVGTQWLGTVMVALGCAAIYAGEAMPEGNTGIATKYPGDQGIQKNKSVIFASGFENGFAGWKHNSKVSVLNTDKEVVHRGKSCAQTTATKGDEKGGDIVFSLPKSVDQLHVRFYAKFHKDTITPSHFVKIQAIPKGFWPNAGRRPPGDKAFWTGIEPSKKGKWMFYTYWHKMRSWNNANGEPNNPPEGTGTSFYGNVFHPDNQKTLELDKWICVEAMLKANTPGKSDGAQAFWIDGKLLGHWKTGTPVGSFIRDKFVTSGPFNKNPAPFPGFEFRKNKSVQITSVVLQWYFSKSTQTNIVYFDDIVVATQYVGPLTL